MRVLKRSHEREPAWIARLADLEGRIEPLEDADGVRCQVSLHETDRGLTLTVRGALDAAAMPALSTQFDQLQCSPCDEAVLDLRDVSVVDCVGLNALAGLSHYIDGRGGTLVIRSSPGAIRGLLVSTGLGSRLEDPGAARTVPSALTQPV